jgi:8-oxo-dGTP pyrophosphatase MutT (NUDIX family)
MESLHDWADVVYGVSYKWERIVMLHRKVQCWIYSKTAAAGATGDAIPNALDSERCLLLLTNEVRGSYWQPVTGSVEPGEGYFEAACREPLEETGFTFNSTPVDSGFEFDFTSRFGPTRERIFALTVEDMPIPKIDPNEHQAFQWIHPRDALRLMRFRSNFDGLKLTYEIVFGKELR